MEEIINKKIVIETIGNQLEVSLLPFGFKFVKSKHHLIRKYKGGFDKILLSTITGYPHSHQELDIQFSIRIDEVENILEKFYDGRFRNMSYAKASNTYSTNYIFLKDKNDKTFHTDNHLKCELCQISVISKKNEFVLHTTKDIKNAASFLENFIELRVFRFFEQHKNIKYLNKNSKI